VACGKSKAACEAAGTWKQHLEWVLCVPEGGLASARLSDDLWESQSCADPMTNGTGDIRGDGL